MKKTKTKSVDVSTETIQAEENFTIPPMPKPKRSNTHGIANLKSNKKESKRDSVYQLMKSSKDNKGRMVYPVIYMIKAEDIIYDPEKDINRKIRYIPGEQSIFEEEQKKDSSMMQDPSKVRM